MAARWMPPLKTLEFEYWVVVAMVKLTNEAGTDSKA
jgi:hypothetical protein